MFVFTWARLQQPQDHRSQVIPVSVPCLYLPGQGLAATRSPQSSNTSVCDVFVFTWARLQQPQDLAATLSSATQSYQCSWRLCVYFCDVIYLPWQPSKLPTLLFNFQLPTDILRARPDVLDAQSRVPTRSEDSTALSPRARIESRTSRTSTV